ncbi:alpha/beta fold hydrolase [Lactobacillus sp. S2-2]|uniref:alpha/beta fold hydrolase n=1 Tax=Lactobacillus sp. S2-2 TaxID=2692917 RepID=UPI00351D1C6F
MTLNYDDLNPNSHKVIILLAGIGSSKVIWENQISVLLEKDYRVINLDARNQGDSQRTKKGTRISKHAVDLKELISDLDIKNPILMGNSMGAATIYAYISLFGTKNIKGVISIDQTPKMINTKDWKYGYKDLSWENFPDYMKLPIGKVTYQKIDQRLKQKIKIQEQKNPYDSESNLPLLIDHSFQDWRSIIYDIDIPILFVVGDKSPLFNYRFIDILKKKNVNIKGVVIKNVGHIIMAENPTLFNKEMFNFIDLTQNN